MSRLSELISELCPDGVEYKKVREICSVNRGRVISKDYIINNRGKYPVYSSQTENDGILGSITTFDYDGEFLTWTTDGANAGTVFYRNGKFSVTNVCGLLEVVNQELLPKFLFYVLVVQAPKYVNKGMGNPKLMSNVMETIKVPVPPLEVQREIVRVLDHFTFLTAELTAELTARKKQYECYREKLLSFETDIPQLPLRDIVKHSCSGATPTKGKQEFYENAAIPWIRTQDVKFNEIWIVDGRITEEAVRETAAKWIPENCVIVAISGATAGRCAVNKIKATTNQHCLNMEINPEKALYKYVFYCMCNKYQELLSKKQGARGDLNSTLVLDTKIPVPPLPVQERLVNVLDNFDAICSDLNIGLPAEIALRQKQYEYYRDALLTFAATGEIISYRQTDRQTDRQ